MVRKLAAIVLLACTLAACRVDVDVDVQVNADGSGTISVITSANADVVSAVPGLAEELVLDDVTAAGWVVNGPVASPDGGLTVTLSHDFSTAEEATNLLNSLGPPFNQMALSRNTVGDDTTNELTGLLGLTDGFASFADDELVTAVGSLPFAAEIEASGATPESSMSVELRAQLPGELVAGEFTGEIVDGGALQWTSPLDGTIVDVRARTIQAPGADQWWARPLSIAALVALVVWVTLMTLFIGYVTFARWRRARRYKRRHRNSPKRNVTRERSVAASDPP